MVTGWAGERRLEVTSPRGRRRRRRRMPSCSPPARASGRAPARLHPRRPAGRASTPPGSCRTSCTCSTPRSGSRAVVVGAELVSWSAVLTLREAGCSVAALMSRHPRAEAYAAFTRARPQRAAHAGRHRHAGRAASTAASGCASVEVEHVDTGRRRTIECDTVVTTGDWVPDHELARLGGLDLDRRDPRPGRRRGAGHRRCRASSRSATSCTRSTPPTVRPSTAGTSPVR